MRSRFSEYYRSNYRWTEATMITIALIESEDKGESFESTVAELMSQQPFEIIDTMLECIIHPNETVITLKRKSG